MQEHSCVGRGRNLILEASAHGQQLRERLQSKKKGRVGAACRLQDLREIGIGKWGELIQNDADHWPVFPAVLQLVFIALAHHQLQVLQQHTAQSRDGLRVLVGIEGDEQYQFLINHFIEREQVVISSGDDRKVVLQEGHQLVQESLYLRDTVPVFERLLQVADRHFKIQTLLIARARLP